jgi:hypothetical protein
LIIFDILNADENETFDAFRKSQSRAESNCAPEPCSANHSALDFEMAKKSDDVLRILGPRMALWVRADRAAVSADIGEDNCAYREELARKWYKAVMIGPASVQENDYFPSTRARALVIVLNDRGMQLAAISASVRHLFRWNCRHRSPTGSRLRNSGVS